MKLFKDAFNLPRSFRVQSMGLQLLGCCEVASNDCRRERIFIS